MKAGLKPVEVDLIAFAVTRTQLRGLRGEGAIALIDVGAETTTVVVTDNGVPQFVRMIPADGSDVTRGIMSRLSLGEEAADGTKVRMGLVAFGGGTPDRQLAMEAVTSVTGKLLESIRNTITYYDNTHAAARVDRIVLSGGGARLSDNARGRARLAHRRARTRAREQELSGRGFLRSTAQPAAARVNLLPPEIEQAKRSSRLRSGSIALAILSVLVVIAATGATFVLAAAAQARLFAAQNETILILQEQNEFVEARTLAQRVETVKAAQLTGTLTEIEMQALIRSVDATLPAGVFLLSFAIDSGTPIEDFPFRRVRLNRRGSRHSILLRRYRASTLLNNGLPG